jgi:predicted O-methyltransferase YrrM
MAMSFMRDDVKSWLLDLARVEDDPVLADMHREAKERGFPIVGPEVGRLLFQLASASGARRIFEMGSGFGYSTLWFARGVGPDGRVHHTDGDPANTEKAREYLERAGLGDRVTFTTGDARDVLRETPGEFDIVFMDIDKEQYPGAYRIFRDRVKVGGLVVVDNLVWSGKVAEGVDDAATNGVREYLDLMWNDARFVSSLMPVRDGVGVSLRVQ